AKPLPSVLSESSGLARSQKHPGLFWTHNDSRSEPILYAITPDGELRAAITIKKAEARDWEALSSGPCPEGWCLYIGDTGDNRRRRDVVTVYRIAEPELEGDTVEVAQ